MHLNFDYFHRNASSPVPIASPLNLNTTPVSPSSCSSVQYNIQKIVISSQPLGVPTWSKNVPTFQEKSFTEIYVGATEYITSMTEITPTSIFLKLFPESLIKDITFHTNLYATQIVKSYVPATPNEI